MLQQAALWPRIDAIFRYMVPARKFSEDQELQNQAGGYVLGARYREMQRVYSSLCSLRRSSPLVGVMVLLVEDPRPKKLIVRPIIVRGLVPILKSKPL